jgi:hypothetical protein
LLLRLLLPGRWTRGAETAHLRRLLLLLLQPTAAKTAETHGVGLFRVSLKSNRIQSIRNTSLLYYFVLISDRRKPKHERASFSKPTLSKLYYMVHVSALSFYIYVRIFVCSSRTKTAKVARAI